MLLVTLLHFLPQGAAGQATRTLPPMEGSWRLTILAPGTTRSLAVGLLHFHEWTPADSTTFHMERRPLSVTFDSGGVLRDSVVPRERPAPFSRWVGDVTWLTSDGSRRPPPARLAWAAWGPDIVVVTIGRPYWFDAGNWRATLTPGDSLLTGTCLVEGWTDEYLGRCHLTQVR